MKRKIFSITIALVLVTGLCLLPATVSGQGASNYANYQLGKDGSNTAVWQTTGTPPSGNYSVNLTHEDANRAWVEFTPPAGITLAEFIAAPATYGFQYLLETGADLGPQLELTFTDGNLGSIELTAEAALYSVPGTGDWLEVTLSSTEGCHWYASAPDGESFEYDGQPYDNLLGDLQTIIDTAMVAVDADAGSTAAWEMTRVVVDYGWGGTTPQTVYIDDVTINSVTYDLEPMVFDAEYYSIGEAVTVTLCKGNANTDPMAIEEITIEAKSTTDTVGDTSVTLTETGSDTGVFTGAITLVGAAPANRTNDEIVVSAEDTVTVYYSGDWGTGTQVLGFGDPPSATVDDTAPVILVVSPTVSENTSDATPEIKASYSDGGSGIDITTVVMKVDGSAKPATVLGGSANWTSTDNLTEGSHTVTVDVSDLAGNAATQLSWSFTVDTVAPVITLRAATPPVILPSTETPVVFTATVTDATPGSGVATVIINLSPVGGTTALAMTDNGTGDDVAAGDGIYTASENITKTAQNDYNLTVTATDEATNSDTAVIELGVWIDVVDPVITDPAITYPFAGVDSAQRDETVTISATVTDDVLMGTVTATCAELTDTVTMNDDATLPDVTADDGIYTGEGTVKSDAGHGEYTITITATDAKGNDATDTSLELIVRSGATGYELDLVVGWNLISLPLIPDDSAIAAVISVDTLSTANLSSVGIIWGYDAATEEFLSYMPDSATGVLDVMEDGLGYWAFMTEDATLTITGLEQPAPPAVPPTYDVVVGWNLIGFKSMASDNATNYLDNIAETYPVLWSYDATAGAYENVEGGTMEVGHGFWIWITTAGTIVPPQ